MTNFILQKKLAHLHASISMPQRRAYAIVGFTVLAFMIVSTMLTFRDVNLVQKYVMPSSAGTVDTSSGRNGVAVLIETKMTPRVIPVSLHFASVLGPSWPVIIYTLRENWSLPASVPFRRALQTGAIEVRFLEEGTTFPTHHSVSVWLTQPWLWEQLRYENRVLMFQTDSIICANSARTIDDFAEYDFVGAPIDPKFGSGFNGGLSLRNPRKFLQIALEHGADFAEAGSKPNAPQEDRFEDQWFNKMLTQSGGHLPDLEAAKRFAVESMYYEEPFGYHQINRWHPTKMEEVVKYCPEVGLVEYTKRL